MKVFVGILAVLLAGMITYFVIIKSRAKKIIESEKKLLNGLTIEEFLSSIRKDWKNKFVEAQIAYINSPEAKIWYDAIQAEVNKQGNKQTMDQAIRDQALFTFQDEKHSPKNSEWGRSWIFGTLVKKYKLDPYNLEIKKITDNI